MLDKDSEMRKGPFRVLETSPPRYHTHADFVFRLYYFVAQGGRAVKKAIKSTKSCVRFCVLIGVQSGFCERRSKSEVMH